MKQAFCSLFCVFLLLTGCGDNMHQKMPTGATHVPIRGIWRLIAFRLDHQSPPTLLRGAVYDLFIAEDGRFNGMAGCNQIRGKVAVFEASHQFGVSELVSSQETCQFQDETLHRLHEKYLTKLRNEYPEILQGNRSFTLLFQDGMQLTFQ